MVPNVQHDLGTDLFAQARDARPFDRGLFVFDRGLFVGVPGQGRPQLLRATRPCRDRSLLGWWYYEEDADHFDDWVTHGLPHLLVLHDLDRRVSCWVHVTAKAVESTGKGAKILVPVHQTIDPEHLDELLDVAASHKPVIDLQGTAWAASARNLPPARRLRHALLVPRLVALHPNTGFETVIGPGEALALLAQGRVRHLGDVAPARQDAAAALRALLGESDDVTASAIRAAAAELLSSDEFGLSVERTATLHPLWQWQCGWAEGGASIAALEVPMRDELDWRSDRQLRRGNRIPLRSRRWRRS